MHHVDRYGIGKVVDMALDHVGRDRPIHLSFDVGELGIAVIAPFRRHASVLASFLRHFMPY